ncbi:MAG: hypothetical protein ACKVQU_11605 [Burkholderiales bacterium]
MTIKRVLSVQRVRRISAQFSWLDQRLVRDRHIERRDATACALYLFLVTVSDAQGLSYYAEASIAPRLSIEPGRLGQARADLVRLGRIAFDPPLDQALALDAPVVSAPSRDPLRELSREPARERFAALRAQLKSAR